MEAIHVADLSDSPHLQQRDPMVWASQLFDKPEFRRGISPPVQRISSLLRRAAMEGSKEILEFAKSGGSTEYAQAVRDCEPLVVSAAFGHEDMVQLFVEETGNVENIQKAIHVAASNGHLSTVQLLLQHRTEDVSLDSAFAAACSNGNESIVNILLDKVDIRKSRDEYYPIELAAMNGQTNIVSRLLAKSGPHLNGRALVSACWNGRESVIRTLLEAKESYPIDLKTFGDMALRVCCWKGYAPIVRHLLSRGGINPQIGESHSLALACQQGHVETVQVLLNDSRVDPTCRSFFLRVASQNGHVEVVKKLLDQSGIEPDEFSIRIASQEGHFQVVRVLLEDGRLAPLSLNRSVRCAAQNGYNNILDALLSYSSDVDPSYREDIALIVSCQNGHLSCVQRLLEEESVNPASRDNMAIIVASQNGHVDVVKFLLSCPLCIPNAQKNRAVCAAAYNNRIEVCKILQRDSRVDVSGALKIAKSRNFTELISVFTGGAE